MGAPHPGGTCLGDDLDDGADGGASLADGIEIGFEKRRRLGIGTEEGIFADLVPIPVGAINGMRTHLHEGAAYQHGRDDFAGDGARRHAHGGFAGGGTAAAAMVANSIFRIIGEIGVAGPVGVLEGIIVFRALIGVLDQQPDGRSRRHLAFGFFIEKYAGEDFDLIGFLPLGGKARGAGAALIKEDLDLSRIERDQGRAAIDDAADRWTVAFAKSRDTEKMAEGVVGHKKRAMCERCNCLGVSHEGQ